MLLVIAVIVAVGLAAALWFWGGQRQGSSAAVASEEITIFFPSDAGWVAAETREILEVPVADEPRAQRVVEELVAGPTTATLYPLFPTGTAVDAVFIDGGTCRIELISDTFPQPPQMGSRQETEMFASLVRSVSANVPVVERVVVLWNGRQPESFGGHLDTTRPVGLNQAWAPTP